MQLKRNADAVRVLESLVAKTPKFPEAHVSLALAYLRLGEKEKAARHRKLARELMVHRPAPNR